MSAFSLPTQRCFLTASRAYPVIALFSAYAEVFPGCICFAIFCVPFLCLRRGVSETVSASFALAAFSLPTQRCFLVVPAVGVRDVLFSAYAEVFPGISVPQAICLTFLCLRRGVSTKADEVLAALRFSLPTQRCFLFSDLGVSWKDLFSAYAEVFLAKTLLERRRTHFSLPSQRCFRVSPRSGSLEFLFSAYAEVFLSPTGSAYSVETFLCLRRGVSRTVRIRL